MYVFFEFIFLRFFICNYIVRDFILSELKIEIGVKENSNFVVGVFLVFRFSIFIIKL